LPDFEHVRRTVSVANQCFHVLSGACHRQERLFWIYLTLSDQERLPWITGTKIWSCLDIAAGPQSFHAHSRYTLRSGHSRLWPLLPVPAEPVAARLGPAQRADHPYRCQKRLDADRPGRAHVRDPEWELHHARPAYLFRLNHYDENRARRLRLYHRLLRHGLYRNRSSSRTARRRRPLS